MEKFPTFLENEEVIMEVKPAGFFVYLFSKYAGTFLLNNSFYHRDIPDGNLFFGHTLACSEHTSVYFYSDVYLWGLGISMGTLLDYKSSSNSEKGVNRI
jgi:hypothetical protein